MDRDTVVVIPCFNEAARLDEEAFRSFLSDASPVRVLFVDDGSTDGTVTRLARWVEAYPEAACVLTLDRNVGKAEAVRRGVLQALDSRPAYIGYWDADLATPLDQIRLFRSHLEQDVGLWGVLGSRVRLLGHAIHRRPMRHYAGRVFATAASATLGFPVYDTQCGAKMFRAGRVSDLFADPFVGRWVFDVELLARIRSKAERTKGLEVTTLLIEHPLPEWRDRPGSKLGLTDITRSAWDLARVWSRYRS